VRPAAPRAARRRRGFTLVEVLIALTLLSLLMLVLTGALRSMGEVEERVDQRIAAADDHRAAVQLLGDVLGLVSARRFPLQNAGGPAEAPFFEAAADSLSWVGVMPARFGIGGRHYLHLGLEQGRLVLRYAPWTGAPGFAAWGQAQAQVLAAPVQALSLRYLDPATGQWSDAWPPPGVAFNALPATLLPEAVQIQVVGPEPAWPPLVATVAATRASDPSIMAGSFGAAKR